MINNNYKTIIWVAGKFGVIAREHAEELIYKGKYGYISANRTFSKLVDNKLLKRIDRGKRKADAYKLTNEGGRLYKREFGEEPKMYNSGDKLSHSIQIVNFYIHIINDLKNRYIIEEINLMEEKRLLFKHERQLKFIIKDKIETIIPDAFFIYKHKDNKAKVCYVEIENSERKATYVAQKTLNNYERYFLSNQWSKEVWQPKTNKIFPYILIVSYSEFKTKQLIKEFKRKLKIETIQKNYYFSDYNTLKSNGISGDIWYNIDYKKVSLF